MSLTKMLTEKRIDNTVAGPRCNLEIHTKMLVLVTTISIQELHLTMKTTQSTILLA